jgi:hypothetical protein
MNILKDLLIEMAHLDLSSEAGREIFSECMVALNRINEDKNGEFEKSINWYLSEIQHTIRKHDMVEYEDSLVHAIDELKVEITKLYQGL